MMKTALSIIQGMRYRLNLSAPTSIVSSTDPDVLQMIHLLYAVCEELRQSKVWAVQKKRYQFNTVSSQDTYVLPEDYYSPILNTYWNQSENNQLIGPTSDASFNWHLHGNTDSSINFSYRIFGGDTNPNSSTAGVSAYRQFEINPTPSDAVTLSFDYISRDMFKPANWQPSTAYDGSATPVKVNSAGYNYQTISDGTSSTVAPSGESDFTDNDITWTWLGRTPIETIEANTDLCIFDYDLVILGLIVKWTEYKGGDFMGYKQDFNSRIEKAVSRYKGSFIGNMLRGSRGPYYHVPYRNWSI